MMSVKGGVPSLYSTILLNQPKVQEEKVTLYFLSFFLVYTLLFVPSQRRSSPFFPSCFLPFMLSSPGLDGSRSEAASEPAGGTQG
jgi:hypothetical protein